MKPICIKMSENLLETIHRHAKALHVSPEVYIRRAIERMNRQTHALLRAKPLADASKKVRKERAICVGLSPYLQ